MTTIDTSPLETNCVLFNCNARVAPGSVYCPRHLARAAGPTPTVAIRPAEKLVETELDPPPTVPDMATMEPHWDGTNWILKPRMPEQGPDLDRIRELVRALTVELGITGGTSA